MKIKQNNYLGTSVPAQNKGKKNQWVICFHCVRLQMTECKEVFLIHGFDIFFSKYNTLRLEIIKPSREDFMISNTECELKTDICWKSVSK